MIPSAGGSSPRTLREELLAGDPLSGREIEILELVADGRSSSEIGRRLFLAEETVRSYRRTILAKLAARNAAHAVRIGISRGYVSLDPD